MGTFRHDIELGSSATGPFEPVNAVIDTGAAYTSAPASVLHRLGITPHDRRVFLLADGRTVERDVGRAWVRVDGRQKVTLVIFGDDQTPPLCAFRPT